MIQMLKQRIRTPLIYSFLNPLPSSQAVIFEITTMRLGNFLILIVATLAFIGHAGAKTRYLKGEAADGGELLNAEDEERGWQDVVEKLKANNILKNTDEFKGAEAAKWENAAEKLEAGGKLETKNAAKAKWQNALAKLKAEGKLTEAGEEKLTKVTEEAALAVKKNPKKWPYIKKALEITFGAVLTAAIVVGIEGMIGSS